jgi:hypothetical protein
MKEHRQKWKEESKRKKTKKEGKEKRERWDEGRK